MPQPPQPKLHPHPHPVHTHPQQSFSKGTDPHPIPRRWNCPKWMVLPGPGAGPPCCKTSRRAPPDSADASAPLRLRPHGMYCYHALHATIDPLVPAPLVSWARSCRSRRRSKPQGELWVPDAGSRPARPSYCRSCDGRPSRVVASRFARSTIRKYPLSRSRGS